MTPKARRTATTILGLAVGMAAVSACSVAKTGQPQSGGPVTSSARPESSRTTSPPADSSSSPTSERSFSPASIAIGSKVSRGSVIELEVKAPPRTRFRIGQDMTLSVDCRATAKDNADPVSYHVVCPVQTPKGQLIATISYGDFDYTFMKVL